ncbi:hypothetical protein PG996_005001 [Apiospora saccharicola]|uniref:Chromo domain-containing protein n=1 Tax=Apiospora saccharicola TaxID=335842 RepID=A0ABR1VK93_9PEZI
MSTLPSTPHGNSEELSKESNWEECEHVEKYARWTVVEDEAGLQGASKLEVRRRFVEWRDRHCVWRPGQPWFDKYIPEFRPPRKTLRLPRFN